MPRRRTVTVELEREACLAEDHRATIDHRQHWIATDDAPQSERARVVRRQACLAAPRKSLDSLSLTLIDLIGCQDPDT